MPTVDASNAISWRAPEFTPADPLAGSQWHLAALGNLTRIWDEFTGAGIHVGIYDDGIQYTHHDLNAPYDATRQIRIGTTTYDGINLPADAHGTSVAGLIAAENDGIGTVGIAFGASITGINIFDPSSPLDINASDASGFFTALRQGTNFDVINHSWGSEPLFDATENPDIAGSFGAQTLAAYAHVAANGRATGSGLKLGTIIVQAAGNEQRDANGDGLNASRYTITVAAVANTGFAASYSNHGASILVAAPGSEDEPGLGITSTDLLGVAGYNNRATPNTANDYTDDFGGTSAATPIVTAVVALMLDANPGLGWRDVQNILAASARQTGSALGATVAGLNEEGLWQLNRADGWNGGGMHTHADYGYGLLNAYNAVRMAEAWSLFGEAQTSANEQSLTQTVNMGGTRSIPDNGATSASFTVASGLIVEHVDITLTISHRRFTDLRIFLTSAEGTKVTLVDGTAGDDTSADSPLTWTFGIDTLRGEAAGGSWKLDLQDVAGGTTGTLANNFAFKLYGTVAGTNSVYHYTDELGSMAALPGQSGRLNLADGNGGTDWIDAAAVSGDSFISLLGGTVSRIAGRQVIMSAGIENAVTGDGDDDLIGDAAANRLHGMRGQDRIEGGDGDDILDGGAGNDTLLGGLGNDQMLVDSAGDMLVENAGEGTDTAWISAAAAVAVGCQHRNHPAARRGAGRHRLGRA